MAFSTVIRRSLSSTAALREVLKTPIPLFGTSGSYTEALYSASLKTETKDSVANDLLVLNGLLENQKVTDFMTDPFVESQKKLDILNEVACEGGMSETSVNFFGLLAENNRLNLLGEISEMFSRLMSAERGEVPVTITTAAPLDETQKADVEAAIAKFLKPQEVAILTEKIDESLLGGLVLSIGDKYTDMKFIDMSTSSKIKMYLDLIKQPV